MLMKQAVIKQALLITRAYCKTDYNRYYPFLRLVFSLIIRDNSRPVWPFTLVFS